MSHQSSTQAKKKKMDVIKAEDLQVDLTPRVQVMSVSEPPTRQAGSFVETVDELVDKLKNKAKVI